MSPTWRPRHTANLRRARAEEVSCGGRRPRLRMAQARGADAWGHDDAPTSLYTDVRLGSPCNVPEISRVGARAFAWLSTQIAARKRPTWGRGPTCTLGGAQAPLARERGPPRSELTAPAPRRFGNSAASYFMPLRGQARKVLGPASRSRRGSPIATSDCPDTLIWARNSPYSMFGQSRPRLHLCWARTAKYHLVAPFPLLRIVRLSLQFLELFSKPQAPRPQGIRQV